MTSMQKPLTNPFIDLFAGAGGLSLGLEQAGFQPVFVNELNPDAMKTYLMNRMDLYPHLEELKEQDIKQMVNKKYLDNLSEKLKTNFNIDCKQGDLDLIVGGPPCQGFSGIGHRRSYSVSKDQLPSNFLFQDMAYVISRLQPKIFLFENVRGVRNTWWQGDSMKINAWEEINRAFQSIENYLVEPAMIYSKDYGSPQNRPRMFLIGLHRDLGIEQDIYSPKVASGFLPEPSLDYPHIEELIGDLVDDSYENGGETLKYPKPATNKIQRYFRKNNKTGKVKPKGASVTEHKYSKHSESVIHKFQYMIENNGKIPDSKKTKKFAQRLLPRRWGSNGPSITVTSLPDDFVHYQQPRTLSVREWARLQMFPDWYEFAGKRTTGGIRRAGNPTEANFERELPKYTQIGNSVPVVLAKRFGNHFLKLIN